MQSSDKRICAAQIHMIGKRARLVNSKNSEIRDVNQKLILATVYLN